MIGYTRSPTWSDVIAYDRDGLITPNLQYWPWQMGAPVVDGDGNPDNYDLAAGDRPELMGHQRLWWVMNDVGNRHANSRTDPLGIEVHLSAIAASSVNPHIDNTAFFTYRVINRSSTRIDSAFFVPIRPGPLGGGWDDYAGIDTSLGLAYSYNADNDDGGYPESRAYGIAPPAVGVMLLEGFPSTADHMDNDYDKSIDEAGEVAGIGHFMVRYEWGFSSGHEYYSLMNGRFGDGSPIRQGGDGRGSGTVSRHHYPGDPVVPVFWSERRSAASGGSNQPGERSWSLSFGPFVLEPGGEVEFATAIVWARGSDHIDSVVQLREAAVDVREAWFAGLPVNEPLAPESAELVAPADGAEGQPAWLTLRWQRSSERDLSGVQVAADAHFEDIIIDRLLHADQTSVTLDLGRRYWWRVAASKQTYSGTWSEPWTLTTGDHDLVPFIPPTDFAVTANAAGPIEPPECGAFGFMGAEFPMSCGADQGTPGKQQSTSISVWGIHSAYSNGRFGPYDEPRTFLAYYAHFTDSGEALASAGNIEFRFTAD